MFLADGIPEAFGLMVVRTSTLVLAAPLLGTGATFSGYKVGLIGVLSVVLFLALDAPAIPPVSPLEYGVLALREVLIGLTLAFMLHAVLLAVMVASEIVGHEMAFSMSRQVDPATGMNLPLIGRINEICFFMALLAVNGHHWLIRALLESVNRAPLGELKFSSSVPQLILQQFAQLFTAGLTFAAPMLVLLSLVSLVVALLARAVPHINVMEFSFTLRVGGGLVALYLFAPTLEPALESLLTQLMDSLEAGLDALGASNG